MQACILKPSCVYRHARTTHCRYSLGENGAREQLINQSFVNIKLLSVFNGFYTLAVLLPGDTDIHTYTPLPSTLVDRQRNPLHSPTLPSHYTPPNILQNTTIPNSHSHIPPLLPRLFIPFPFPLLPYLSHPPYHTLPQTTPPTRPSHTPLSTHYKQTQCVIST